MHCFLPFVIHNLLSRLTVNIIVYILFVHILQIGLRTLVIARRQLRPRLHRPISSILGAAFVVFGVFEICF